MQAKYTKGFTLIELLVVIAIIGVLSSVVLASLNTARSRGNDAGVKANLATVGTQAALYLADNSNSYGTFALAACPTTAGSGNVFVDGTIVNAIASAKTDSAGGTATCASSASEYAVSVSRPADIASSTSAYWCVDNTGKRCGISSNITGTSCGACTTNQ